MPLAFSIFEHAGHPFGEVHADNKTRQELNAEGSPAKLLDLGIVVQPMTQMADFVIKKSIKLAILAVPEGVAQRTTEALIESGIAGIHALRTSASAHQQSG